MATRSDQPLSGAPQGAKGETLSAEQLADAECVRAVVGGNRERFAELVQRYQQAVYSVTLAYSRDTHHAEDLAQEVFVRAYGSLPQLREPARFGGWLLQIARHQAARQFRRRAAQPTQALTPETDPAAPEPSGDAERSARVLACIEELPELYRETLRLKYQEALSCKEIAAREGVPIGTITSRLTRALAVLRTALEP
jgi:RNA polymerase sigma-70 factor (ECF subfamily)